jgi:hypothetical protein
MGKELPGPPNANRRKSIAGKSGAGLPRAPPRLWAISYLEATDHPVT